MDNFTFQNETKIIFGKGTEGSAGAECAAFGTNILLHYGGGSIKASGLYDRIMNSLKEAGLTVTELGGVVPNPRVSLVREGIKLCQEKKISFILAVGGGSVIDSAKAIAAGFYYDGDVWDFYEGKAKLIKALPLGVVLTLPAAGSESSAASVVTREEGLFKRGIWNPLLRPRFAICNPALTTTLPPYQTACGIADMLAHVMERYFTNTTETELSDRLCEATMQTIIHQGRRVMDNPLDYQARAQLMWAGTVAHNDLLDAGRGGDWATHGIEHELSGIYDVAHGAGLAIIFPGWMTFVMENNIPRMAQFASRVFRISYNFENPAETAEEGIEALENFYRSIGLPVRLSQIGVDGSRILEMAAKATDNNTKTLGSFKQLHQQDIETILNLRL